MEIRKRTWLGRVVGEFSHAGIFPIVSVDGWCGDFVPKEEALV